jgi:hypothetical protein
LIEATAASDGMMREFKVGADLADEIGSAQMGVLVGGRTARWFIARH